MDTLTNIIANPRRVRRSQERNFERKQGDRLRKAHSVRDIQPELPLAANPPRHAGHSTRLQSSNHPTQLGRLSRSCSILELQANQIAQQTPKPTKTKSPQIPPCITALNLDSEQMKTNYSFDNVWDASETRLPPIACTQGFGKYTTAIDASPTWRAKYLSKQILKFGLELGTPMNVADLCGIDESEWNEVEMELKRYNSASSMDATSISSHASSTSIDPQTGTRITRGFSPACRSSPGSPSSQNSGFFRSQRPSESFKLTTLIGSRSKEIERSSNLLHRPLSNLAPDRHAPAPLESIEELQMCRLHGTKVERPCDFISGGDADADNAVASEASDDEYNITLGASISCVSHDDEDEDWTDILSPRIASKVSALTQMLEEQKRMDSEPTLHRVLTSSSTTSKRSEDGSNRVLDRSRTIKSHRLPARRASKVKVGVIEKRKSTDLEKLFTDNRYQAERLDHNAPNQNKKETQEPPPYGETAETQPYQRHRSTTIIHCQLPLKHDSGTSKSNAASQANAS